MNGITDSTLPSSALLIECVDQVDLIAEFSCYTPHGVETPRDARDIRESQGARAANGREWIHAEIVWCDLASVGPALAMTYADAREWLGYWTGE